MTAPTGDATGTGGRRTLAAAVLTSISSFLPIMLAGALAVQVTRSMPSSGYEVVAVSVSAAFVAGSLTSLLAGRLVDRIGWTRAARTSTAITAAALVGAAVSGPRPVAFVLAIVVGGIGFALAQMASNVAILAHRAEHRRGTLFGIKQATSPISSLLAGLAVPAIAVTWGWQRAFTVALVLPAIAAAVVPPHAAEAQVVPRAARAASPAAVRRHPVDWPPRRRRLIVISAAGGLATIAIGAITSFLTPTAVQAGFSESGAGLLIVVGSLVGIGVRIGGGMLVDQRAGGAAGAFGSVVVLLMAGVLGFALLAGGTRITVALGAVLAYAGGWSWPGLFHYAVAVTHRDAPGRASGIAEAGLQSGTAIGSVLFALIARQAGLPIGWTVMALLVAAAAATIAVRGTRHERRQAAAGLGLSAGQDHDLVDVRPPI